MSSAERSIDIYRQTLAEAIAVKQACLSDGALLANLERAATAIATALGNGNRVIFAGNGISAADSQHLATEFVSRFAFDRPALPAIALTADSAVLTAIANDYGYENIFRRQLEGQARRGDVFIGLTTSGRSPNVVAAFNACVALGVTSVAFCAMTGDLAGVDHVIRVPSSVSPRIQEAHVMLGHLICADIEQRLFAPHATRA